MKTAAISQGLLNNLSTRAQNKAFTDASKSDVMAFPEWLSELPAVCRADIASAYTEAFNFRRKHMGGA